MKFIDKSKLNCKYYIQYKDQYSQKRSLELINKIELVYTYLIWSKCQSKKWQIKIIHLSHGNKYWWCPVNPGCIVIAE